MKPDQVPDIYIPPSFKDKPYAREHFANIVRRARQHPFYKNKLANAEKEIPLLQRMEILENNEGFLNGNPVTGKTSGSSGTPVKISWGNPRTELENKDNTKFAEWMGGPLYRLSIISTTTHQKNERTLDVSASLQKQITFIEEHQKKGAQALLSYPSNMLLLCEYILEHNIDVSSIKRVVCMSEVYEAHHDALIQKAFPNARTWSNYSSTETGAISFQCPHNKNMQHVMAHKLGVEILDEQGNPCEEGQVGRIIVTDYFNRLTPFIRYEIGDLAAPAVCGCQQISLPAMQNIIGKVRGTLKKLDGSRVVFTDLSVAIRDLPYTRQYQVIQESLQNFTVRFVKKYPVENRQIEKDLAEIFYKEFNYHPQLTLQEETHIEKEKSGKFYASICKV